MLPWLSMYTAEQKTIYRQSFAPQATDTQWNLFITECERRNLVPGVDVIFQLTTAFEYNRELHQQVETQRVSLITTIGALRKLAARGGVYRGQSNPKFYYGAEVFDIPRDDAPTAVTLELFHADWPHPVKITARYEAYVQRKANNEPNDIWARRPAEQLLKCAEAAGLRIIEPDACESLYIREEMPNLMQERYVADTQQQPVIAMPKATVAPAINQAPASVDARKPLPQTSPFPEVAKATAWEPAAPLAVGDKVQQPTGEIKTVVAAPPKPATPAVPKAPTVPTAPKVVTAPAPKAPAVPQTPAVAATPNIHGIVATDEDLPENMRGNAHESVSELKTVADAVARDKDPSDLDKHFPVNLPQHTEVPVTNAPPPGELAPGTSVDTAVVPQAPPHPAVSQSSTDFQKLMNRVAKIVRGPLLTKVKNPTDVVKPYLIAKGGGETNLQKIDHKVFTQAVEAIEKAKTTEELLAILKG